MLLKGTLNKYKKGLKPQPSQVPSSLRKSFFALVFVQPRQNFIPSRNIQRRNVAMPAFRWNLVLNVWCTFSDTVVPTVRITVPYSTSTTRVATVAS
jgi:hypothetical protein